MNVNAVMPASIDAERAILGAILLDNNCFPSAQGSLGVNDFSLDSHRRIYLRMVELIDNHKAIDFVTLTEQLGVHKEIESVGGVAYVTSLTDGLPRVKNIDQYVGIVLEKSRLRQIIFLANSAISSAYDQDDTASGITDNIQDGLLKIAANIHKGTCEVLSEFSEHAFSEVETLRATKAELTGFSFGVKGVDEKTSGLRKRELCMLGGRPGDGKTALALQMAAANCMVDEPVGIFSVEMHKHALIQRLWSNFGRISFSKIRVPSRFDDMEWKTFKQVKRDIIDWPLYIDDSPSLSITELIARAKLMRKKFGTSLIIVDYVQIVEAAGKDERMRVSNISRKLQSLANGEDIAIVALSQMARPTDKSMNRRPTKFDLKESGSLESDANIVLLSFRPVDDLNRYIGMDELIIDKNRSGDRAIVPVVFIGNHMRFESRC